MDRLIVKESYKIFEFYHKNDDSYVSFFNAHFKQGVPQLRGLKLRKYCTSENKKKIFHSCWNSNSCRIIFQIL